MTKKFCLNDRLFVSNRNFTTEHIKVVKNSGFFVQNSRIFKVKKSQIQGFLRFADKVANLMIF